MSQVQIAKKISNKLFADLPIGAAVRIAGTVHSYTVEEGDYGEYKRFRGEFAMSHNGGTFMAGTAFLPEIAADLLAAGVVRGSTEAVDGFKGLEFAIDLFKRADADSRNGRGYTWAVKPVIAPAVATSRALALLAAPGNPELSAPAANPEQVEMVVEDVAEVTPEATESVKPGKGKR